MEIRKIFFPWTLMYLALSASPTSRAEDSFMEFTLSGGPKSHLFSHCIDVSLTVEATLHAIEVSGSESYERFSPNKTFKMTWTDVKLDENSDILDCAMAAYSMKALMFKYDDGCSVTLNNTYNPAAQQSCDDAAEEVVYISSRVSEMNFFGDIFVNEDTFGCLTKSDDGWVYGVEDGRIVDEDTLPPRDSCCRSAASDYCLMAECTEEPMTYCEAEARCLARGLRPASRSFHENIDAVDPTILPDEHYFWVNVYQEEENVWKWQDDGSDLTGQVWCVPPTDPASTTAAPDTGNCAAVHFIDMPHKIEFDVTECTGTEVKCILCYDADETLPKCSTSK